MMMEPWLMKKREQAMKRESNYRASMVGQRPVKLQSCWMRMNSQVPQVQAWMSQRTTRDVCDAFVPRSSPGRVLGQRLSWA